MACAAGCREYTLGDGEAAVLLVHGYGDSPAAFQLMAPALAANGFTCHVLRLPQHGVPMNQYRKTSAVQWCDAVRSAITELRGRHRRVYLLAHSLGAAIAVEAVSAPSAVVDGMTLLAPLFDVSSHAVRCCGFTSGIGCSIVRSYSRTLSARPFRRTCGTRTRRP